MGGYEVHKRLQDEICFINLKEKAKAYSDRGKIFNTILKKDPNDKFQLHKKGNYGKKKNRTFELYQQYFRGIPVKSGVFILHWKDNVITGANGNYIRIGKLNTQPSLKIDEAVQIWGNHLQVAPDQIEKYDFELVIADTYQFTDTLGPNPVLAWKIRLYSRHPKNFKIGYVNAHTGAVSLTEHFILTSGLSRENNNTNDIYYMSGVMSHGFYRLVEGGSGTNGLGDYYKVYGIGIDCAADLIYHAQSGRKINGADDYPEMRT